MRAIFRKTQQTREGEAPIPIWVCRPDDVDGVLAGLGPLQRSFAKTKKFLGEAGQRVELPSDDGSISGVLAGVGANMQDELGPIQTGRLSSALREGVYTLEHIPSDWDGDLAAIGWGLGAYKFDGYLKEQKNFPVLVLYGYDNAEEIENIVEAIHLGRDLINTPPNDMGPEALEAAARMMGEEYGAKISVIRGKELLDQNYPMIHAVGRAAHEEPRLVELEWGNPEHPRLAICGKGITFDTGGVNIKSASSARLMKKDMGGAAHAIALAKMIMAGQLKVRLHMLLAIAENSVSAGAYRPGDILQSRAGKTVEIDNTDAEGRLVLGDALTKASEDDPVLMIDFATLTGAARVALGPTLPPFFTNHAAAVEPVLKYTNEVYDPVWHMPLWAPYMRLLKSPIADMKNAGGGFAGCITAALFLEQFVMDKPWMHFDVYGWNPTALPGHPAGGEMFALRGLYQWIKSGGLNQL